jgi:hypothetical protein
VKKEIDIDVLLPVFTNIINIPLIKLSFNTQLVLIAWTAKRKLTLIQAAISTEVIVRLGVIYDSQATRRKQGELSVRTLHPPPRRSPTGRLEVIKAP